MYRKLLALAAAAPLAFAALPAQAMPAANTLGATAAPKVILVEGGCGLGFHRGLLGVCRPNRGGGFGGPVVVERRCPPGSHLGPYGRACRPNF